MATLEEKLLLNGTKSETQAEDAESDHQEIEEIEAAAEGNTETKTKKKKKKKKKTGVTAPSEVTNGHAETENGSTNPPADAENGDDNDGEEAQDGKFSRVVILLIFLTKSVGTIFNFCKGDGTAKTKKKKRNRGKKKPASAEEKIDGPKEQSDPPTIAIAQLFPDGKTIHRFRLNCEQLSIGLFFMYFFLQETSLLDKSWNIQSWLMIELLKIDSLVKRKKLLIGHKLTSTMK